MKITKRQLKRIIREERLRLLKENADEVYGLFNENYMYDILSEEVDRYLQSAGGDGKLRKDELSKMESAMMSAFQKIAKDYAE